MILEGSFPQPVLDENVTNRIQVHPAGHSPPEGTHHLIQLPSSSQASQSGPTRSSTLHFFYFEIDLPGKSVFEGVRVLVSVSGMYVGSDLTGCALLNAIKNTIHTGVLMTSKNFKITKDQSSSNMSECTRGT